MCFFILKTEYRKHVQIYYWMKQEAGDRLWKKGDRRMAMRLLEGENDCEDSDCGI